MSDRVLLGEIAVSQTGPFGSQLHEEDYVDEGIPIVTVEHLGELGFTRQNLPFVSDEDVQRLSKYTLKEGDIVFSRVGAIDRNTYVTEDENGWMFSGRCIRVRCDKGKVNPLYLSYYFRLEHFKRMMLNVSVGATMPSLNTDIMDSLPIDMAERSEQDRIAKCLSSIDDKIRNNNATCSNLETITKLLYDYWFVQFDFPDQNGKPYKSSGGKMVWNEELKREIPESWEVRTISDIAIPGKNKPYKNSEVLATLDMSVMPSNRMTLNELNASSNFSTNLFEMKSSDILFGSIRPYLKKAGIAPCDGAVAGTVHVFRPRRESDYNYLAVTLCNERMFSYANKVAKGTKMPVVDINSLMDYKIPYNERIVTMFNALNLKEIMSQCVMENQHLASLRDFLLPMLMNGQVKVGECNDAA